MPSDMFLEIDGIKGDSTDDAHKGWIEIESFSHSIAQPPGGAMSAQGVLTGGRSDHDDFSFFKRMDSASPILAQYVCMGKPIPKIRFELCRAMEKGTVYMVYEFKDSIIASVAPAGSSDSGDPVPSEEITVRYSEISWEYTPTKTAGGGKTEAAIRAGWSTRANKTM